MLLLEVLMVSMGAIRANMLRSVLTTLGIVIGIAAVITMVALGEGAQQSVQEQINRLGTTVLTIRPGQQHMHGVSRGDTRMFIDDAMVLRDGTNGLLTVSPEQSSRMQITYQRWNSRNQVMGVWPEYFEIYDHGLVAGRFFTQGEVRGRRRVVVLGHSIPDALGETPAELLIGQTIQVRGIPFEVIGVLTEKGDAAWVRPDDQIFVPQSTAQYRVMGGRDRLSAIYAATATRRSTASCAGNTEFSRATTLTSTSATPRICSLRSTRRARPSRCCSRESLPLACSWAASAS